MTDKSDKLCKPTKRPWHDNHGWEIQDRNGNTIARFCLEYDKPFKNAGSNMEHVLRAVNAHDDLVAACEAVLMIYTGGEWNSDEWNKLTGLTEATIISMCDFVRAALIKAKGEPPTNA